MSTGETTKKNRLRRNLGLVDVFAISTGAMFSSGFFLLPGIAFAQAGAWVPLAYALSALLVIPAMLSKAELASALPRAGGTYYYLDRSMGPLVGTIGGVGTWIAMGLKNTFALIGIGAYTSLFLDLNITVVAIVLTIVFTVLNIFGTKETARLQRLLVFTLLGILVVFTLSGFVDISFKGFGKVLKTGLAGAPATNLDKIFATVGLVFVSYAGLTKVAGIAEEVRQPDRSILLGMSLSLGAAVVIYVAGTFLLVLTIPAKHLSTNLAPIATAAKTVFRWMPGKLGVLLITIAAVAAFASTANAGIMSASRYLFAMGRDRLIGTSFAQIGQRGTPNLAIYLTGLFILIALLTLDVVSIAKLASAFQLLIFALVNLSVIVMRESQIETYDPAVRVPFYPWTPLLGIFLSLALIVEMGRTPMLFTLGLVGLSVAWYFFYGQKRVVRRGAIFHWFERLGRDRFEGLETELWTILKETGLRTEDPYHDLIHKAPLLELDQQMTFDEVATLASHRFSQHFELDTSAITALFEEGVRSQLVPIRQGVAVSHLRLPEPMAHHLLMVRSPKGIVLDIRHEPELPGDTIMVEALFFMVSPEEDPGQHLRLVAQLASQIEQPDFMTTWREGDLATLRKLLTDDALARLARRLTRELRAGEGYRWHSRQAAGRFESIFVVDLFGAIQPEVVELSSQIAETNNARLTIAEPLAQSPHWLPRNRPELSGESKSSQATRLGHTVDQLRLSGQDTLSKVLPVRPWLETIQDVLRNDHDLVIVQAGEGVGFESAIQHLFRKCPCPVWVVRPKRGLQYRRILAAVDATAQDQAHRELNEEIVSLASRVSEQMNADLHLVHVHSDGDSEIVEEAMELDSHNNESSSYYRLLEQLLQGSKLDRERTHVHLVQGHAASSIYEVAEREGIDLVVIGTVSRTGVAGLLIGNTAESVLQRVECAVLTVKPDGFVTPVHVSE